MAQDKITLFNLALSAVGTRSIIAGPTEVSREAEICNLHYPIVRDTILRSAYWQSTRGVKELTIKAQASDDWQEGDPEEPWLYLYDLPEDFLYPRYLTDYSTFEMTDVDGIPKLLSNAELPRLAYTKRQEVPPAWDVSLYNAVVAGLAAMIGMPLHAKPSRVGLALQQANAAISEARIAMANENFSMQEAIPEWLMARGICVGPSYNRFIYPTGPLLSLAGEF